MKLEEKVELLEMELLETKKLLRAAAEPALKVSEPLISKTRESSVLDFSYNLSASEEPDALEEKMPWDGYVMSAIIDWPKNCLNLAGVRITVNDKRMVPRNEQWIALNNVAIPVPVVCYAKKGHIIRVNFKNNDTFNSHYLTVLVYIYNYFPDVGEIMTRVM